ncbi:hypothetical protein NHX12_029678 [Muraenolepis orangiensis]|uniref:SLED domain-containing protein n=1 Tax=Muraenolepis orangiensis TaxID=630683 RepID=A0A9Q0IIR9_9TELE|nr:hypothetical protein NHX12_029678 [Muraenolepis orangiensis]
MSQEPPASDRDSSPDMSEFNWDDYLEESQASSVPHHAFKHVDQGLQTGLVPGMRLEVCVRMEADAPHWVASIITTCGQLLLLRYEGYHDDRRADFWCDIMTADLHPLGWSRQHGKTMRAPEGVREKHQDWEVLLETALAEEDSAPANLLEMLLCAGSYVELQDSSDPGLAWASEVEENVGGRLKLRPLGTEGMADMPSTLWLYYLHPRLHPPGWAQEHGRTLRPTQELLGLRTGEEWEEVRQRIQELPQDEALDEMFPKDPPAITPHSFKEGMKLEAVDPAAPISISPATVTKVFDDLYFLVKMDDLCGMDDGEGGGRSFLCNRESPGIFPVNWSLKNGLPLCPPPGYQRQDFDWTDYLKQSQTEAAPQHCFSLALLAGSDASEHSFKENMKLEAVNPLSPENIHVATVSRVKGQHIWLSLEGLKQPMPEVVVHVDSMDIFPVSWCETNGYPLVYPIKPPVEKQRKAAVVQPEKHRAPPKSGSGEGRIAELPQFIGPGNCVLVLKEVLSLLINSAYKPSRVLRELQLHPEASRWQQESRSHGETLKAKYKGKSYRATVEIVRTAERVAEFCRKTCIKLECCPNLFGPRMVLDHCSENCSVLTKTKYTYYYGKKKSRRLFVHKKRRSSASLDNTPAGSPQGSGDEEDLDDDESLSEDSGSELQDDSEYSPCSPSFSDDENRPPSPKTSKAEPPQRLCLETSPLEWSITDVEIDGQALLLLNLPTVQECMELKLGPAVKLCHHIERVKLAFYQQFAT